MSYRDSFQNHLTSLLSFELKYCLNLLLLKTDFVVLYLIEIGLILSFG